MLLQIIKQDNLPHSTRCITIIDHKNKKVWIVDIAMPGSSRIEDKTLEKITNCRDLQIEMERLWHKKGKSKTNCRRVLGYYPVTFGTVFECHQDKHEYRQSVTKGCFVRNCVYIMTIFVTYMTMQN